MLRAVLPMDPMARPRQEHRVVMPKDAKPFVQSYTPSDERYDRWRQEAVLRLRAARHGGPALSGPLGLKAVLLFKMPKGEEKVRAPRPRRWHTAKPDVDNVLKAVMDSMTSAGWMADDARVVQVEAQKIVAAQGEPAALHLTLAALPAIHLEPLKPAPPAEADMFRNVGEDGLTGFDEPMVVVPDPVRIGLCRICGTPAEYDESSGGFTHVPAARPRSPYSESAWELCRMLNTNHSPELL